jgi:hypothetical protein
VGGAVDELLDHAVSLVRFDLMAIQTLVPCWNMWLEPMGEAGWLGAAGSWFSDTSIGKQRDRNKS